VAEADPVGDVDVAARWFHDAHDHGLVVAAHRQRGSRTALLGEPVRLGQPTGMQVDAHGACKLDQPGAGSC
jgi:hypothetical protein